MRDQGTDSMAWEEFAASRPEMALAIAEGMGGCSDGFAWDEEVVFMDMPRVPGIADEIFAVPEAPGREGGSVHAWACGNLDRVGSMDVRMGAPVCSMSFLKKSASGPAWLAMSVCAGAMSWMVVYQS